MGQSSADSEQPFVFLNYTQAELDRNFDQRAWINNADEMISSFAARSELARRAFKFRTVRYGETADETLDVFVPPAPAKAVNVFVHGGAWLNFTKDHFSFVAASLVPAGISTIVLNFSKLPGVSLAEMIHQVRRGIRWAIDNMGVDGDTTTLSVSGWSSGAHLAAMALADVGHDPLPADKVRSAFCVSGPFDLVPVVLSARGSYVKLDPGEDHVLSPIHNAGKYSMPFVIAYAENDTNEFQRQSNAFARALDGAGKLKAKRIFEGFNHFELIDSVGEANSPLSQFLISETLNTAAQWSWHNTARNGG